MLGLGAGAAPTLWEANPNFTPGTLAFSPSLGREAPKGKVPKSRAGLESGRLPACISFITTRYSPGSTWAWGQARG